MRARETWLGWAWLGLLVAGTAWPLVYGWRLIAAYAAIPTFEATPVPELDAALRSVGAIHGGVGLALDAQGAVYLADPGTRRVLALGGPAGGPRPIPLRGFDAPWDVAVGPSGRLYVIDHRRHLLRVVTPSGETVAEYPVTKGDPAALAVDRDGASYVADPGAERLRKFLPDGSVDASWGDAGEPGSLFLQMVAGMAVLEDGLLVASGGGGGELVKVDASGRVVSRTPARGGIGFLAAAPSGRVYMSDGNHNRVWVLDRDGNTLGRIVGPGGVEPLFGQPRDLAVGDDYLYVVNVSRVSVYRLPAEAL